MNILYFIGAYGRQYAANEIHYELGREFVRQGHSCRVLAPITRRDLGEQPLCFQDGEVAVERFLVDAGYWPRFLNRLSWRLFRYPYFLQGLLQYRRLLRRHPEIDVVHADAVYPMGAIAALSGCRAPLVPSVHGGDVMALPGYGYGRFALVRALTRRAFRRAAVVRINSPLMAELSRERGCPPSKIHLLEVNIGDRFFEAPAADLPARRREARARVCADLGLAPEAFLLLSLGRLIPLKGVEEVVRAAAHLARTVPQAHTIVAGPGRSVPGLGDYGAYLAELAASLGTAESVTFAGELEYEQEVPRFLAAADLFLSPSHLEGLNRVVAEAGALGTPSVVSQGTGIAPLVQELGAGLVVPVGDVEALAGAVARLACDAVERRRMAERSRALAERFRSRAVALGLLELYRLAIEQESD
ncbi:MAG: glycosyltransferase family 4 protein [Chloroflexia bacterium]|nr:glycosyltransferase family 4 protein [Chloroflexia bacterium]